MKFSEWVYSVGGREKAASLLGVTRPAFSYWLQGKAVPKAETMARIVKLSKGKVTIGEIVEETGSLKLTGRVNDPIRRPKPRKKASRK